MNLVIKADEIVSHESYSAETAINSEAIYISRSMSFTNLSKPINSTRIQIEDPEGKNIKLLIITKIIFSY